MEFVQQGTWLRGFEDGEEVGSVELIEQENILHIKDLQAKGYFMEFVQKLRSIAKGKTVRIVVQKNDGWEKLLHAYAHFGFEPIGIVMEMEVQS